MFRNQNNLCFVNIQHKLFIWLSFLLRPDEKCLAKTDFLRLIEVIWNKLSFQPLGFSAFE